MGKAPCPDSGWRDAAQDTPSLDRVWPLGAVSSQVAVGVAPQVRRARERGESLRVVDQTAEPALSCGLPVGAPIWWPQFPPEYQCGPAGSQIEPPWLVLDHVFSWPPLPIH